MYSIGEVSKQTGVTVRTLQYYDKIDLLNPVKKTEGGNRLYSKNEIIKLQQIIALKFMQYPLEDIKQMLGTVGNTWEESLQQQLHFIEQEEQRLATIKKSIRATLQSIELENDLDWNVISQLLHLYQKDDEEIKEYLDSYFDKEEQEILQQFPHLGEEDKEVKEWLEIIKEVQDNLDADPSSEIAQNIAKRWMGKVEVMFEGNEGLRDKSWDFIRDDTNSPKSYPINKEVIEFIEKAVEVLYER